MSHPEKDREGGACVEVDQVGDNVRLRSTQTFTACQMTLPEWRGLLADIAAGRWAHIGAEQEAVSS